MTCILWESVIPLVPSPVRNEKAKFLPPSHASTRQGRHGTLRSTFATPIIRRERGIRGNRARAIISHLKNWARPQLFSVSEGIKLQNLKSQNCRANQLHNSFTGEWGWEKVFMVFQLYTVWRILKHRCHDSSLFLIYLQHLWRNPQPRKKLP